jgi:dienelactone hydrolase
MRNLAAILLLAAMIPLSVQAGEPQTVQFPTLHRDHALLRGFVMKPDGDGPFAAVLLLHGCSGPVTRKGTIAARERSWMDQLVADGYAVMLLDSFNPRGFSSICTKRDRPITAEQDRPYDAYAALRWLRAQPYVMADKIAAMGWSHGAMTVLATISDAMIEEIGWTEPGFATAVAFYPGCLALSKTRYSTPVPLLMQLGEKDDWTPPRYCIRLADKIEKSGGLLEMDVYKDAYHAFDNPSGTVHERSTSNTSGTRRVHVGRNPEAAEHARARTRAWLATAFAGHDIP